MITKLSKRVFLKNQIIKKKMHRSQTMRQDNEMANHITIYICIYIDIIMNYINATHVQCVVHMLT